MFSWRESIKEYPKMRIDIWRDLMYERLSSTLDNSPHYWRDAVRDYAHRNNTSIEEAIEHYMNGGRNDYG
jgi:hypothetical protein